MSRWLPAWADLVAARLRTTSGKWIAMTLVFGLLALLFHPLFLIMGGVIGAFTFGLAALGGWVLGPAGGALFGFLSSVLSIPLWVREYGFSVPENISGPIISLLIGYGGGAMHRIVQRVRDQSHALQRSNAALRTTRMELLQAERLALFGEVAAGVAHELNQPLTIIGLSAQMARTHLPKSSEQPVAGYLAKIEEQVDRARQIVLRLRAAGRVNPDEQRIDCDLNGVVRGLAELFEPQFHALGIAFGTRLSPDLPALNCHPDQIQQVLTFLLLNARDAVQESESKRIEVVTRREGEALLIEVIDSGTGIAPEHMVRIFDPFFTTKDIGHGSGLGLPICHRIVAGHGGTIGVRSTRGAGAHFTVTLPLAGVTPAVPEDPPEPSAAAASRTATG